MGVRTYTHIHKRLITNFAYSQSSSYISLMTSLLLLFLSILSLFSFSSSSIPTRSEYEVDLLFEGWLVKHNKSYNKDSFEKTKRYEIFKDNLKYIDEHNAGNHTYTLGLNVFSDLTVEEYRNI